MRKDKKKIKKNAQVNYSKGLQEKKTNKYLLSAILKKLKPIYKEMTLA